MTDRVGRKVSEYRLPQPGEEVTFRIVGRGGTAEGKVKTITDKVEGLVMPGSDAGFLKGSKTAHAFQFIGSKIRNKMSVESVHFDALQYGSTTERAGRKNEIWHIEFELQAK